MFGYRSQIWKNPKLRTDKLKEKIPLDEYWICPIKIKIEKSRKLTIKERWKVERTLGRSKGQRPDQSQTHC